MGSTDARTGRAFVATDRKLSYGEELREVVRDYWTYRELLFELTRRDVRIRYKQAVMGFGWAVFMPILIVLSGVIVRFAMAKLSGEQLQTGIVAGITVKAVPWAFFVGAIGFASGSLINNMNLVTKVYFPREVLPLSSCLAQAFDSLVGGTALLVLLPFLGVHLTFAVLWLPVLVVLLFLLTTGLALVLSSANLFFRDVKYIVNVLLTFGIFFTPVFVEPAMLGEWGAKVIMLNPLSPLLEGIRLSVVEGHNLLFPLYGHTGTEYTLIWSPLYLLYSSVLAVAGLLGSAILFHRLEFLFAEYV